MTALVTLSKLPGSDEVLGPAPRSGTVNNSAIRGVGHHPPPSRHRPHALPHPSPGPFPCRLACRSPTVLRRLLEPLGNAGRGPGVEASVCVRCGERCVLDLRLGPQNQQGDRDLSDKGQRRPAQHAKGHGQLPPGRVFTIVSLLPGAVWTHVIYADTGRLLVTQSTTKNSADLSGRMLVGTCTMSP